ncbi:MAG: hypothetical protein NTV08_16075 [Verrucomicrobia bacterium]|nr:hypothetical protein [Verrucomicrobiota bacterium]
MAKEKPKKAILVTLREQPYQTAIWFNQFRAETHDGGQLLHFGLHTEQGMASLFSVFLEADCIQNSKESTLGFLEKIGGIPTEPLAPWRGLLELRTTPTANMIMMSAAGDTGEIRMGVYAHGEAVEKIRAKQEDDILGTPIALLHCKKELIRQVIAAIYT